MPRLGSFVDWILEPRLLDGCDDDERVVRRTLVTAWVGVIAITPFWGVAYISFGEVMAGLVPLLYGLATLVRLALLRRFGRWEQVRVEQLVQHLLLPFVLTWLLGGFSPSSAVLIWALLAPLSALWAGRSREASIVIVAFAILTTFTAVVNPLLAGSNELPEWLITTFFAGNFVVMATVIFVMLDYFVRRQAELIDVMRRNRELESAYLRQEVSLRQNEKLATIGKLSAGLAHELNNPAAAVQQATRELADLLLGDEQLHAEVARLDLSPDQERALWRFASRITARIEQPEFLDPLERSDREGTIEGVLASHGVEQAWQLAPSLVSLGLDVDDVMQLRDAVDPERFSDAVGLLGQQFQRQNLVRSLDGSTSRIVGMVGALKTYAHLDQGPRQVIDVHEGLDSTLVMLQNRLKTAIEVRRNYDPELPDIEADVGELNQVWTNILDNAIAAMDGSGVITLTTFRDGDDVVVELEDDGPGVRPDLVDDIFDPFVTSKPPGEGTGLGLSISHQIITEKHGGQISLASEPGRTTFVIRLPLARPTERPSEPAPAPAAHQE